MNRITKTFSKGPAFVGFLTAGDGGYQKSLEAMLALIQGGVNILEIGVPFSDPVADGPIIQQASERALQGGFTLKQVFQLVFELRKHTHIPIILFSYYNPIFCNQDIFYREAKNSGVDGVLVVDLPLEESEKHLIACKKNQLDPIFLIAPSTSKQRLAQINSQASGMLYYVCRSGTTGMKGDFPEDFAEKMTELKKQTRLPIVTGFGISNKSMAALALQHAEGFVVGSLFVEAAHRANTAQELGALAKEIDPRQ